MMCRYCVVNDENEESRSTVLKHAPSQVLSNFVLNGNMDPPKFSVHGLHRGYFYPKVKLSGIAVGSSDARTHKPGGGVVDFNLSTSASSTYGTTAKSTVSSVNGLLGDFWSQLQTEVLVLREMIQKGQFSGILETIDQYARQVCI
jgi:hypothetical protein